MPIPATRPPWMQMMQPGTFTDSTTVTAQAPGMDVQFPQPGGGQIDTPSTGGPSDGSAWLGSGHGEQMSGGTGGFDTSTPFGFHQYALDDLRGSLEGGPQTSGAEGFLAGFAGMPTRHQMWQQQQLQMAPLAAQLHGGYQQGQFGPGSTHQLTQLGDAQAENARLAAQQEFELMQNPQYRALMEWKHGLHPDVMRGGWERDVAGIGAGADIEAARLAAQASEAAAQANLEGQLAHAGATTLGHELGYESNRLDRFHQRDQNEVENFLSQQEISNEAEAAQMGTLQDILVPIATNKDTMKALSRVAPELAQELANLTRGIMSGFMGGQGQ